MNIHLVIALVSTIITTFAAIDVYQSNKRRKNDLIMIKRNIAKRYVDKHLRNAKFVQDGGEKKITCPEESLVGEDEKFCYFLSLIKSFQGKVSCLEFFNPDGNANNDRMDWIIQQIDLGMYDEYLGWPYEHYENARLIETILTFYNINPYASISNERESKATCTQTEEVK